ncbi:MAG: hypothetical protein ACE5GN_00045, partial [Waddliaceae bacterium]
RFSKTAELGRIKHLNQTERKTLKVMLKGLKVGKTSVEIKAADVMTLTSLRSKLSEKRWAEQKEPSSLITKIMKFFLNIMGLRISSNEIMKEIETFKTCKDSYEAKLKEKSKEIKTHQDKIEQFSEEVRDYWSQVAMGVTDPEKKFIDRTPELKERREAIKNLKAEVAELERIISLNKKISEWEEVDEIKRGFLTDVLKQVETKYPPAVTAEHLKTTLTKDKAGLEDGHVDQFLKDFIRRGNVVTISDPRTGTFHGKQLADGCKSADHLQYHIEGLSKVFRGQETNWLHLAEANMTQTVLMAVTDPIRVLVPVQGQEEEHKKEGYFYKFNDSLERRNIYIDVVRDKHGAISHFNIKADLLNFVELIPEEEEKGGSSIPVSAVKSDMSYSVKLADDGVTPVVYDLKYEHSLAPFIAPKPEKIPKSGFTPVVPSKKLAVGEAVTKAAKIEKWQENLSELKLDTRPTQEKIDWLKRSIKEIKEDKTPSQEEEMADLDANMALLVLDSYQEYLDVLS